MIRIGKCIQHYLFFIAIFIQNELIQGVIAKKSINIPSNIFNCGLTISLVESMRLTLNIIIGMLNNSIITLPIAKFLSFIKFIEPEIEDNEGRIGEPIKKVNINKSILSVWGASKPPKLCPQPFKQGGTQGSLMIAIS